MFQPIQPNSKKGQKLPDQMFSRIIWPEKRGEKCIKIAPQLKKYSLSEEGKSRLYLIKKMNVKTVTNKIGKNLGSCNHPSNSAI